MTSETEIRLTRDQLFEVLTSIDTRASGNASDDETYKDLPTSVLAVFRKRKDGEDAIAATVVEKTLEIYQKYYDKKIDKNQYEDLLKKEDDQAVQSEKDLLDQSRDELATELAKYSGDIQQEGLNAAGKLNELVQEAESQAGKSWEGMTPAEVEAVLRAKVKKFDDSTVPYFGF